VDYDQTSPSAPTVGAKGPYKFSSNVDVGSTGTLLSSSSLTPPSGNSGTLFYDVGSNGLSLQQQFQSVGSLDAAYPVGTYNLNIQTTIPNTYTGTVVLTADNFPSVIPQITGLTNASWIGGQLVVTNPALPVTLTWTTFNSAVGNIHLQVFINNSGTSVVSQNFTSDGTHNSFTIPGGSFTNNTYYQGNLSFQNNFASVALGASTERSPTPTILISPSRLGPRPRRPRSATRS